MDEEDIESSGPVSAQPAAETLCLCLFPLFLEIHKGNINGPGGCSMLSEFVSNLLYL